MPRRTNATNNIKVETVELDHRSSSPVSMSSRIKPPPTVSEMAPTFHRSDAPSIETRRLRTDHSEAPVFMEARIRDSSPSSGHLDMSFAGRSFAQTHPDFAGIGMKLKACNDTLGNLQQLGIQHVATLPELVLVGDQSAGKSSLMSGLARLNLPRSGGVCTRCPIHIRMSSGNGPQWSCTVSLQLDYNFVVPRGGRVKKTDVTERNPFPPWVKKPNRDSKIFKTIYDPTEIEDVLRWAQIAILNPNISHELYVPNEGAIAKETELPEAAERTEASFSPNIVALEMKGPDLPDLSFYDLPGVFLSPDKEEDDYLVKVVRNLTKSYIQRPEAIIMWALPMNHDLENSISLGIIREAKATDRTIGVITKADMLQEGNIPQWLAVLQGKKQSVKHGYFLTSLPPGEALENAANHEENFFRRGVGSWPNEFSSFENQCGVERLRQYITKQLGRAFERSLPLIKTRVEARLTEVNKQLSALPELPKNVEYEVRTSLSEFYRQIKIAVKEPSFISRWNTLNSQFQHCIHRIKPTCIVREAPQTIDLESDTDSTSQTPKRPRPNGFDAIAATPTKRFRPDGTPVNGVNGVKQEESTMSPIRQPSFNGTPGPDPSPFSRFHSLGRPGMDIRDIRKEIMEKKRAGMPHNLVPPEVYEDMSLRAIRKWEGPISLYMTKTMELVRETVNSVLSSSLETFKQRMIFRESQQKLNEYLNQHEAHQRGLLTDRFNDETYQMFTMNNDAFERYKLQEAEVLGRARNFSRLKAATLLAWEYVAPAPEKMSAEMRTKERKMFADLLPRIGEDPFTTELQVASVVRGYYLTAASHFVEGVTKEVNARLFRSFSERDLSLYLETELGLFPYARPETYQALMEEDRETARERQQLRKEQEKLEAAITNIKNLESSSAEDADDFHDTATHHSAFTIEHDFVGDEDDTMEEDECVA